MIALYLLGVGAAFLVGKKDKDQASDEVTTEVATRNSPDD